MNLVPTKSSSFSSPNTISHYSPSRKYPNGRQANKKISDIEFHLQISPLDTSAIEDENSLSLGFPQYLLNSSLTPNSKIHSFLKDSPQETLLKTVQANSLKIQQLEIDLEYYVEQLRITTDETECLQQIIQEKDKIIQELVSSHEFSLIQKDFTVDSEQWKSKSEKLENLNNKLMNEVKLLKKFINEVAAKSDILQNGSKSGRDSSFGFHRKLSRALEKEIQMLRDQNNALRIKICEIQGYDGNQSNNLFRILRSELKLNDPQDILNRVLYLHEYYSQTKELKVFLNRLSVIIREKTNQKVVKFSDIVDYIEELLSKF